jgi:PPIC-type PPIASE domain
MTCPPRPWWRLHAWVRERLAPNLASLKRAGAWNALWREPLVHFLVLGAVLFVAYGLLSPSGRDTIVVDRASIDRAVAERAALLARPLTEAERHAAITMLIDDEILLREAYRRGLDRDAVVTRHLVQKMRYLLGEEQPEPSEADLRSFLEANRERYRTPPTVTLQHVFYADAAEVPADLRGQLQDGPDLDGLGSRLLELGPRLHRYSLQDLIDLAGPEVARRVFELPVGQWQGQMSSDQGAHFIRVAERHPPDEPGFEEIEDYLRQDWLFARQEEALAEKLTELRANYRIITEDGTMAP